MNEHENEERDIELLRQIAAGNHSAFAEFYDRHSTVMFSVACKILQNPIEAEDVMQEVFLQIWEKAKNFDPKLGRTASWTAILVRNRAIDRLRASQRRSRLAEESGAAADIARVEPGTANDALYGHEKAALIQSVIGDLPADQKQAIEMAYFSGLTQHEISTRLNTPLGTIKARIRRGLLKLRDQLEGLL